MATHATLTLEEFADTLKGGGRLLALDLGTKTIGLAISDDAWSMSLPAQTLKRRKFTQDAEALLAFAQEEKVAGLIIGLPLNMDESVGPRAQSARAFARNLSLLTGLPILMQDERLSTDAAAESLAHYRVGQAKVRGQLDAMAAAIILDAALERLRRVR